MSEKLVEEKKFTCPKCGSHYYGSTGWPIEAMVGHCSTPGCGFTWPRTEDAKYFKGTGRFYPATVVATTVVGGAKGLKP